MTDHRKLLESTPEPATLDRTMPAPSKPATQGANIGGITQTAESGLRNDQPASGESPQPGPDAQRTPSAGADHAHTRASKSVDRSASSADAAARADANTPEDESALESLGRAIGAPLDGEASDPEPRR